MHCTSKGKIVSDYFTSWQNHDIVLLREIFMEDAKYKILSLKRSYKGIDQIIDYWKRNSARQKDICVSYKITINIGILLLVNFSVTFIDEEEDQCQLIKGNILLSFRGKRISCLREKYTKTIIYETHRTFSEKSSY